MDPLRKVNVGDGAGRLFDAQTFNLVMDATKFFRGRMATKVGAGPVETDPLVPSCKVFIRNTTGSTLLPWSCVTPTGVAPIDPETLPVNANDQPVFEVQAPAATTDPVLITMEPIAVDAIGEAAALGVCVAQVNVTDGAHRFAVPQVGSTASLASAASGPVRILAPWNTGNSTRLVMLCGETAAATPTVSSWKEPVRVATTVAGTLASSFENGDTIDGVVLATGNRILIKNQSTQTENGIYTVNASGAPTRGTDADTGAELLCAVVMVSEGTTNKDTVWGQTTNATITVGSSNIVWAQLAPSTGTSGVTAEEADGAPSYASTTTLRFDQTDGFILTQPGPGIARVDFAEATATQAGIVGISSQTFEGNKEFRKDVYVCTVPTGLVGGTFRVGNTSSSSFGSIYIQPAVFNAGTNWSIGLLNLSWRDSGGTALPSGAYTVWHDTAVATDIYHAFSSDGGMNVYVNATTGFSVGAVGLGPVKGITATKTVKDGAGVNQTVTIKGGIITGWT